MSRCGCVGQISNDHMQQKNFSSKNLRVFIRLDRALFGLQQKRACCPLNPSVGHLVQSRVVCVCVLSCAHLAHTQICVTKTQTAKKTGIFGFWSVWVFFVPEEKKKKKKFQTHTCHAHTAYACAHRGHTVLCAACTPRKKER